MDETVLRRFLTIVGAGSFGRAAKALGVSQPTLSRQMAGLETELGVALFVRHRQGVGLSRAGERVCEQARSLLRQMEHLRTDVRMQVDAPSGPVVLGLPVSLIRLLGPQIVASCRRLYPAILLQICEGISDELEDMLIRNAADLAILISDRRPLPQVAMRPLAREDVMIVGPRGLTSDKPIDVAELAGQPLIVHPAPNHLRWLTEIGFRRKGLRPNIAVEVDSLAMMLDLVREGLGYAIVPRCVAAAADGPIETARARGLSVSWTLAINKARAATPATQHVEKLIHDIVRKQIQERAWKAVRL